MIVLFCLTTVWWFIAIAMHVCTSDRKRRNKCRRRARDLNRSNILALRAILMISDLFFNIHALLAFLMISELFVIVYLGFRSSIELP